MKNKNVLSFQKHPRLSQSIITIRSIQLDKHGKTNITEEIETVQINYHHNKPDICNIRELLSRLLYLPYST